MDQRASCMQELSRCCIVLLSMKRLLSALTLALKMCLYDLRYTKAPSAKQAKSKTPTVPYRVFPWENASESFKLGFDYNPELGIIATASRKGMYFLSISITAESKSILGVPTQPRPASNPSKYAYRQLTNCLIPVATCHYSLSPQREEDIDLFSVRTGKQLDSLFVATTEQWPPLTCITFAHLGNTLAPDLERKFRGGEQLSLLASQGGNITEWSCEGTCPVDEEDGKIDNDSGCVPGDCVVHDFRISSRTRYSTPSSEGSTSASETGRRHRPLFSRPHR